MTHEHIYKDNENIDHDSCGKVSPLTLEEIKKIAAPACREFGVKRLDVFGSLARGEENADSDVDLLVEFENPDSNPSKRFFGLLHHFEDALQREVDLLTLNSLKNPYFRRRIMKERANIYMSPFYFC